MRVVLKERSNLVKLSLEVALLSHCSHARKSFVQSLLHKSADKFQTWLQVSNNCHDKYQASLDNRASTSTFLCDHNLRPLTVAPSNQKISIPTSCYEFIAILSKCFCKNNPSNVDFSNDSNCVLQSELYFLLAKG